MQTKQSFFLLYALFCSWNCFAMEVSSLRSISARQILNSRTDELISADNRSEGTLKAGPFKKRVRDEEGVGTESFAEDIDRRLGFEHCMIHLESSWKLFAQRFDLTGGHERNILATTFIRNKRLAVSACAGGKLCLWDLDARGDLLKICLQAHTKNIYAVAASFDQQYILTGSEDGTAGLWRLVATNDENLQPVFALTAVKQFVHPAGVMAVAFSHDGNSILTGSKDGKVRLFEIGNLDNAAPVVTPVFEYVHNPVKRGRTQPVRRVQFSPDDSQLMACGGTTVLIWSRATGECLSTRGDNPLEMITAWGLSSGRGFVPGYGNGYIGVPKVDGFKKNKVHPGSINAISFSPDDSMMLTGTLLRDHDTPAEVCLWAFDKAEQEGKPVLKQIQTFRGPQLFASSLALSSDNGEILCGDGAGNLILWSIKPMASCLKLREARFVADLWRLATIQGIVDLRAVGRFVADLSRLATTQGIVDLRAEKELAELYKGLKKEIKEALARSYTIILADSDNNDQKEELGSQSL